LGKNNVDVEMCLHNYYCKRNSKKLIEMHNAG